MRQWKEMFFGGTATERSRRLRVLAETATAMAAILAVIWSLRYRYPILSAAAILTFVLASHRWNNEAWSELGFRLEGAGRPFREWAPALGWIIGGLLLAGTIFGSFRQMPGWQIALGLLLYCIWGLCQQYLLNGFFLNRMSGIARGRTPAVAAACVFSLIHLPNPFLMAVCLGGGWLSANLYCKHRSLWFLGVAHGVIGFLLYLVVPDSITHRLCVGPNYFDWAGTP